MASSAGTSTAGADAVSVRTRIERFVSERIVPLEADRARYDEYDNLRIDELDALRAEVKAAGLWAPHMPRADGGLGLSM